MAAGAGAVVAVARVGVRDGAGVAEVAVVVAEVVVVEVAVRPSAASVAVGSWGRDG